MGPYKDYLGRMEKHGNCKNRLYRGMWGSIGLYKDNGKENANYCILCIFRSWATWQLLRELESGLQRLPGQPRHPCSCKGPYTLNPKTLIPKTRNPKP